MFWPSVALVAICAATSFYAGYFDIEWMNLVVIGAGVLLAVLLWLLPLLSWLGRRYVITTRRIVLRHGLFVRTRQELLHSRGYDITVRKNALQSIAGSGDVLINTGLDSPVVLRDIPVADLVQGSLHDLMERSLNPIAARRQAEQSARSATARTDVTDSPSTADDDTAVWGRR
jgi:uncharacterized membrane protein YdbT with pleckstrin-like domain